MDTKIPLNTDPLAYHKEPLPEACKVYETGKLWLYGEYSIAELRTLVLNHDAMLAESMKPTGGGSV